MQKSPVFFLLYLLVFWAGCRGGERREGQASEADYKNLAVRYADEAQGALAQALFRAMSERGPEGALVFCHENAYALTDSLARRYGVSLRRVTDKARNPANRANEAELAIMGRMQQAHAAGEALAPVLIRSGAQATAYKPIMTKEVCMACHGNSETEISAGLMAKLREL